MVPASAPSKWKTSIAVAPASQIQFLPLFERGQPERLGIGAEEAHGMRIEGGDDGRAALRTRPFDGFARHRLMAKVKPVEIAQRDDGPA